MLEVLEIITSLLLALHLLATNIASAGPLATAWLARSSRAGGENWPACLQMAKLSLVALLLGAVLGGGLMLLPNPGLRAALARFPADAYWFAGLELLFSAACMAALFVLIQRGHTRPAVLWGLAVLSSTNLLYHFPPLMAVIGELAADPGWAVDQTIDRRSLLRLWARPEVLALWVHITLASIAAAAIAAMWLYGHRVDGGSGQSTSQSPRRLAAWALAASLLQLPVGLWLIISSRGAVRDSLMGGNVAASACFAVGVLAALGLLKSLAEVALGDDSPQALRRVGWLLVLVTVLMSATLRASRSTPDRAHIAPVAEAAPS